MACRAFVVLSAVFLVVTGGEALYADLGHFGRIPIRNGWLQLVLPALTLNYLGQGALVLQDPDAMRNPFYLLAPSWLLIPLIAARHGCDHHRIAGSDLRRILGDTTSDESWLSASTSCGALLCCVCGSDLCAGGQLADLPRHALARAGVQVIWRPRRGIRHRGLGDDAACRYACGDVCVRPLSEASPRCDAIASDHQRRRSYVLRIQLTARGRRWLGSACGRYLLSVC